jgi:type IV secretion system protein TrbJ
MDKKSKKVCVLLGTLFLSVFLFCHSVLAQFAVFDVANLIENIIMYLEQIESVAQEYQQVKNSYEQISHELQTLKTLGPSQYANITKLIGDNIVAIDTVEKCVKGISYTLSNVEKEYKDNFPNGWDGSTLGKYQAYSAKWIQAQKDAQQDAMRAQSVIGNIKTRHNQVQGILSESQGADGEVRQLQAANQLLGQLSGQLADLTQELTVSDRMNATAQSVQTSRDAASQQIVDDSLATFKTIDKTPPPYPDLPSIK